MLLLFSDGLGQDLHSKNKQIWGKGTPLPNSSLRLEEVARPAIVEYTTFDAAIKGPYPVNKGWSKAKKM